MASCKFFLQGRCTRGEQCRFSHVLSAVPSEVKVAEQQATVLSHPSQPTSTQARGLKADAEPFIPRGTASVKSPKDYNEETDLLKATENLTLDIQLYLKEINRSTVSYAAGAEVRDIKLPSDYSTFQILGLPTNAERQTISHLLETLGYQVAESGIQIKSLGSSGAVAEVKVDDPKFAAAVARKFDAEMGKGARGDMSIRVLEGSSGAGSLANRRQLGSVTCTWYKPSRVAWLHYSSEERVEAAKDALENRGTIFGRKIQCSIQRPAMPRYEPQHQRRIWSVQVGNLDVQTTEYDFRRVLKGRLGPLKVVLGQPSHSYSDADAGKIVEGALREIGELISFEVFSLENSIKMKAMATFQDRSGANEAIKTLHQTKLPQLAGSKLFVNQVISVKYNVLLPIWNAVQLIVEAMKEEIWATGHIHLKSYASADPKKPFTTVRIYGEDLKQVAAAKTALETILAGTTLMHDGVALWHEFFLTPGALAYLNDLCLTRDLYIHRDARKLHLIMYGGNPANREAVQDLLRVEACKRMSNTIVLEPELLKRALHGGWRRIKERFGQAAVLNVSGQPKKITITGTILDLQTAELLLLDDTCEEAKELENGDTCPVCWCEAVEPLKPRCGHTYCKDCFHNQCASASDGNIPLKCHGEEGKCGQTFAIEELHTMLSYSAFQDLLAAAFDAHIRMHPRDFQNCPTPDCPQIYRPTADGSEFICSACLAAVCTTCNVMAHDGMTCEEFKDVSSEGAIAFKKWKKENDARPCPKCKVIIQKNFGCNHMECILCKAHICWFCMQVFETSKECYGHMRKMHGNFQ